MTVSTRLHHPTLLALVTATLLACTAAHAADAEITKNRRRASQLFLAITGLKIGIDDARLTKMETLLDQNKEREAVKVATSDPAFYDSRMFNFGRKLWTTTESYLIKNNDFVATLVGVARDGVDAREILTGNYYYEFDISDLSAESQEKFPGVLREGQPNNEHYEKAFDYNYSMYKRLKKTTPAMVFIGKDASQVDSGGLLTTRSFIVENATGGTNRRLVEYAFRSFMCVEMLDWTDATRSDDMVGRDVDRFAGGSNSYYQTSCKSCHAQMDAFRPAFAYTSVNSRTPSVKIGTLNSSLANNKTVFPSGYAVNDSNWKNYATGSTNADKFGWRGTYVSGGSGINQFGQLIGNSKGFSRCMARRMFFEVCKRDPTSDEESELRKIATQFEETYKFTDLAEIISLNSLCLSEARQ